MHYALNGVSIKGITQYKKEFPDFVSDITDLEALFRETSALLSLLQAVDYAIRANPGTRFQIMKYKEIKIDLKELSKELSKKESEFNQKDAPKELVEVLLALSKEVEEARSSSVKV